MDTRGNVDIKFKKTVDIQKVDCYTLNCVCERVPLECKGNPAVTNMGVVKH